MFRKFGFVDAIQDLDPSGSLGLLDLGFKVFCFVFIELLLSLPLAPSISIGCLLLVCFLFSDLVIYELCFFHPFPDCLQDCLN